LITASNIRLIPVGAQNASLKNLHAPIGQCQILSSFQLMKPKIGSPFESVHRLRASALFHRMPPCFRGGTPPSSGAGGGSNGDGRGRISPQRSVRAFADAMPTFKDASELKERLILDMALMEEGDDELRYITGVSKLLNSRSEMISHIDAREFFDVLHFMAYAVDGLTDSITASSHGGIDVNPAESLSYIHTTASILHGIMESQGIADEDVMKSLTDVQRIFAIKGTNYMAQISVPLTPGGKPFVARTVLYLCNAIYMYNILEKGDEANEAEAFLDRFKKHHGVPDEEREWIMGVLSDMWDELIGKIVSSKKNRGRMMDEFEVDLRTLARSLTVFSPWIYRETARILEEHGLGEMALEHLAKAETKARILARYGVGDEISPGKSS